MWGLLKKELERFLGRHGEMLQAPYYSFIRKIQSKKSVRTREDLERCISEYKSKGLKEEALCEIAILIRPDLTVGKAICS